jgi:23S rRNA (adenine2030-N6)-methyltransferase
MLSYRHAIHAGNHGDVLKHGILARVLAYLTDKDRPLVYVDTHAGAGRYRLDGKGRRTDEAEAGIGRIWREPKAPALLQPYLTAVRTLNEGTGLSRYPGSPLLAQLGLRPRDRAVLYELHSTDFARLGKEFVDDARFRLLQEDGFAGLKAQLPPTERRALILMDPSYELDGDYRAVTRA